MKFLLYLFCYTLSFTSSVLSQWYQQNSGTNNRFLTCFFLNENIGWAAGNLGTIVKTTNGGQNWFDQSISTVDHIHSIFFADSLNGWITLYEFIPERHGVILRTTNGGENWTMQHWVWYVTIHRIFFVDANNGYVLGSNGFLLKTTNAGLNWIDIRPFYDYWLYSTFFFTPSTGWIGGGLEGYLLKTSNGGQNWTYINLPVTERMMCINFFDSNNGWACGAGGKIVYTTNAGSNWMLGNSGVNVELRDILFIDQKEGWSVGLNGRIIHTTDGGINWVQQTSGTSSSLFGVYFADALNGWIVGENGVILKTDNGGIPVELISFNGVLTDEGNVNLRWSTGTEINNSGFEIERKTGTKEFDKIGFVPGFGTTTEPKNYSFKDENLQSDMYVYRLKQIDYNGTFEYSNEIYVYVTTPVSFSLEQNYPNPFNPTTTIEYSLAGDTQVNLQVFDALGNTLVTLVNGYEKAGKHNVVFDARSFSSGIYYYKLNAGEFSSIKKLVLLK
jgi:photosystem II stability/assembly factor-like uncharacterized protein